MPYVALGLAMSVFYGASGVGQTVSGFLVDRVGAHRVLLGGMALFSASIALAGLVPTYWLLLSVALLAGLGNSVFHPADYSILNAAVNPRRIGRGYSVHAISGNLGWAVAPSVVVGLTAHFGWRAALVTVGAAGLAVVSVLATQLRAFVGGRPAGAGAEHGRSRGAAAADRADPVRVRLLHADRHRAHRPADLRRHHADACLRHAAGAGHRGADRVPGGWRRGHPGGRSAGRSHAPA